METVLIAAGAFVLYLVAYHTYGRYLARRVFRVEPDRVAPSAELEDGIDYVPSRRDLVFGHHFTSIAGTGPIVGPAIAVVWGWVPALVWVLVGSVVMGAVHDFGSLVISMRHRGRTISDLAGDVVSPRVRLLFMLVVVMGLWVVLAIFGLVIATIFSLYPSSVIPVMVQIPVAIALGVYLRRGGSLLIGSVVAVGLLYASIAMSASMDWEGRSVLPGALTAVISPQAFWTLVLLGYVFVASVLPVQTLLQPRDYINSHQLLIAMGLLVVGVFVAHPPIVADAVNFRPEPGEPGVLVPPFFPFLFVTIACGAISGFHCLVSSGCSSRQLRSEGDAQYVGYGAMLTEGFLATMVILACAAGIGLGTGGESGQRLVGEAAWGYHYAAWGGERSLGDKLAPFVVGSANMIEAVGIGHGLAVAIMGVFVASFAATTLDSATRLQRYVIAELAGAGRGPGTGGACGLDGVGAMDPGGRRARGWVARVIGNRYVATGIAVVSAGALALSDVPARGWADAGLGGLTLWPIFGATNQLLGGLALLVVTVWLIGQGRPAWVSAVPMVFMLVMTGWAIVLLIEGFSGEGGRRWHLLAVSLLMLALEVWIVVEAGILVLQRRGMGVAMAERGQ